MSKVIVFVFSYKYFFELIAFAENFGSEY